MVFTCYIQKSPANNELTELYELAFWQEVFTNNLFPLPELYQLNQSYQRRSSFTRERAEWLQKWVDYIISLGYRARVTFKQMSTFL